ncbi:MAG: hypothetical protein NXH80_05325 [Rhodobacteraceae bacterium]|nr:hypothetical protein [Paracoccaceae bacterium]
MSVIESFDTLSKSVCPNCGDLFEYRSNKKYCKPKCRKAHSKLVLREEQCRTKNNMLPSEVRQNVELWHLNAVLSEKVYTMPPQERMGYVEDILQVALHSKGGLLRALLQNKKYQYPNRNQEKLFFRNSPKSYKTFPQLCNHYLLNSPWNCYLQEFLKGNVPEPSTGEALADGTINIRIGAQGWKPAVAGHKKRKAKEELPRVQKGPARDPSGRYIHPWYYDGQSHRTAAKEALSAH